MPAIHELLSSNFKGFEHVEPTDLQPHIPTMEAGTRNIFLRCPIPPLGPISVDNLDQFDLKGLVPQYRVLIS